MGLRQKMRILKRFKNPNNIPKDVKEAFENHPLRKGIELMAKQQVFEKVDYKPIENALDKAIHGLKLNMLDKRLLGNLVGRMQKGTGYTKETRRSIDEELPVLIERACNHKTGPEDIKNLEKLKDWLLWNKQNEKVKILYGGK